MTRDERMGGITSEVEALLNDRLEKLELPQKVEFLNRLRQIIHAHSPFAKEPVDCVQWVSADLVEANGYNPNSVAPPEMKLLEHSIVEDGYTQPIVAWKRDDGRLEVVDGFHRNRVAKESLIVNARIKGFLPLVIINGDRTDLGDRMASTIRHNRARGKHRVDAMADIVVDLKRRNWSDEKIARDLGMDADEVLRLSQIKGLAEMFADREFSEAWEADSIDETDDIQIEGEGSEAGIL